MVLGQGKSADYELGRLGKKIEVFWNLLRINELTALFFIWLFYKIVQ